MAKAKSKATAADWTGEKRAEVHRRVCEGIANKMSLRAICAQPGMPNRDTIRVWLLEDEEFAERYHVAREARADARSEYIDEICDEVKSGKLDPNAARVIIDAEKWQAGKENSKRYGDKLNFDGDLRLRIPDEQVESRLAHLLGKAGAARAAGGEGPEDTEA